MMETKTTLLVPKRKKWPWRHIKHREYYLDEEFRNGNKIKEKYMHYGVTVPDKRECSKEWYDDGKIREINYGCETNTIHLRNYIIWYSIGQKRWTPNGDLDAVWMSRRIFEGTIDEPNICYWHPNGVKSLECWVHNICGPQIKHRKHGPALLSWHDNGQQKQKQWWLHGKKHNENGPAIEEWDRDGVQIAAKYYIRGQKMPENEHREKTRPADVLFALRPFPLPIKDAIWHYYSHY